MELTRKLYCMIIFGLVILSSLLSPVSVSSQGRVPTISITPTETASPSVTPTEAVATLAPKPDLTQKSEETLGPLEKLLTDQKLGSAWPANPIKYAIRSAVGAGVPANTIILLLLLPGIAAIIAGTRHLVGIRGFGIFLPAALSVSFVAIGPILGIGLFLVIITVSTFVRFVLRVSKIKLQYLPRMALLLLFVVLGVLGVLFLAPIIRHPYLTNVSIFPVLVLVLMAEEFSQIERGKSEEVAINLTVETLILSLGSYIFLTSAHIREFVLLNPEIYILLVFVFNIVLGKYVGLRLIELWRFRRLIKG